MIQTIASKEARNPSIIAGDCREIDLLLCCSRTCLEAPVKEQIKALVKQDIDWSRLITIAEQHGVKPLLYQSLNQVCANAIPPNILNQLKKDFRTNAVRNLYLTRELLKLLKLFTSHDIPVLCIKGPALATLAYGDLSLRQFSDLDILIYEKDIIKSKDLILSQGFKMRFHVIELTEQEESAFMESQNIHKFVREGAYEMEYQGGKVVLEIHWEVIPNYFSFSLQADYLWANAQSVSLLGQKVSHLCVEDTLLLLCGHGTKDCWDKLNRVCDIAELLHNHPQLNWKKVRTEAKKRGGDRLLLHSLLLTHNLLGISLPEAIWHEINQDQTISAIANQAQEWLFCSSAKRPKPLQQFLFILKTKEHLRDKLSYALSIATTPTLSDWALLPQSDLPPVYYYLLRSWRILRNTLQR